MDENNKFDVVGTNIAEKATMIWNVADMLRGPFKPHEYGLVILPMTVVKRFHDCLLPTHKAVLEQYEKVKNFAVKCHYVAMTRAKGLLCLAIPRKSVSDQVRKELENFGWNLEVV